MDLTLIDRYDFFENERKQVRNVLDVALRKPEADGMGWYSSLRNYGVDMEQNGIPELELPKGHHGETLGTMRTRTLEAKDETSREHSLPNAASTSSQSAQNLPRLENHNFFDYVKSEIAYNQQSAFTLPRGSNDSSRSQANLVQAATARAPPKYCKLNQTFDQTFINDQED